MTTRCFSPPLSSWKNRSGERSRPGGLERLFGDDSVLSGPSTANNSEMRMARPSAARRRSTRT